MVPINKDISINLNKLMDFILPKQEKYVNAKIIFYIRLYTGVMRAEDNLNAKNYGRVTNLCKVVRNIAKNSAFKEEETYLKRIRDIASEVINWTKKIEKKRKKHDLSDAYAVLTKLQLAQNLCILRILKRSEK